MPRTAKVKKSKTTAQTNGNGIAALTAQLWQATVNLRGSIEPAGYKRYVLPIIFLRFLSLRYERRRAELERLIADPASEYYTTDPRVAADIPVSYQQVPALRLRSPASCRTTPRRSAARTECTHACLQIWRLPVVSGTRRRGHHRRRDLHRVRGAVRRSGRCVALAPPNVNGRRACGRR